MSFCSDINADLNISSCCPTRPMTLEEKRQLMERDVWIKNVVRILNIPLGEAEHLWVRISVANYNEGVRMRVKK